MSFSTKLVKFVLISINLLSLICGMILTVMGTILVSNIQNVSNFKEMVSMNNVSIGTLATGLLVVLISALGCWGTLREKCGHLRIYSVVFLILFLCQLTLVVYIWKKSDDILMGVVNFIQKVFDERATDFKVLHTFERVLKCCGAHGDVDYWRVEERVPGSCCGIAAAMPCPRPTYTAGCRNAVKMVWNSSIGIIKYGAAALSAALLTISLMSTYLARKIESALE